eukprot:827744-Rhodomonas_salina.3
MSRDTAENVANTHSRIVHRVSEGIVLVGAKERRLTQNAHADTFYKPPRTRNPHDTPRSLASSARREEKRGRALASSARREEKRGRALRVSLCRRPWARCLGRAA